jgi:hypothetical protein
MPVPAAEGGAARKAADAGARKNGWPRRWPGRRSPGKYRSAASRGRSAASAETERSSDCLRTAPPSGARAWRELGRECCTGPPRDSGKGERTGRSPSSKKGRRPKPDREEDCEKASSVSPPSNFSEARDSCWCLCLCLCLFRSGSSGSDSRWVRSRAGPSRAIPAAPEWVFRSVRLRGVRSLALQD